MKLLFIDDEADLLSLAKIRLERLGISIFTAQHLEIARHILQKHPNLTGIVCDLLLNSSENGMDFFEAELLPTFPGKFILVTGEELADPRIAQYAKTHPRFHKLLKPYSLKDILSRMNG